MPAEIPEVVVSRLPLYARALSALAAAGETLVRSQTLGEQLDVTPAQIRKDFSYFGRFGKQGRGYNVRELLERLREILGLDRSWQVCIVGVGRLGQAVLEYGGFAPQGFHTVAAFDISPEVVGRTIRGVEVVARNRGASPSIEISTTSGCVDDRVRPAGSGSSRPIPPGAIQSKIGAQPSARIPTNANPLRRIQRAARINRRWAMLASSLL